MPLHRLHRLRHAARLALSRTLVCLAAVLLAGLGRAAAAGEPTAGPINDPIQDRIQDLRLGRATSAEAVLAEARGADLVLLGELHDNPLHHARRAALLAALRGSGAVVVAEQLQQGERLAAGAAPLLARLEAAGFEPRGWAWPLHEPLFAAIDAAGLPLWGGNLAPAVVRRVAREGAAALPPALAPLLAAAPLAADAEAALDEALLQGHCGQLPPSRLGGMRLAQRARDAALWQALSSSGGSPAVLVAGNGHVRRDHGVPQLQAVLAPGRKLLSVGFGELGDALQGPYDLLWLTAPAQRGDPCEGMAPPAAASAPSR